MLTDAFGGLFSIMGLAYSVLMKNVSDADLNVELKNFEKVFIELAVIVANLNECKESKTYSHLKCSINNQKGPWWQAKLKNKKRQLNP